MKPRTSRNHPLDGLRGLCALSVFSYHVFFEKVWWSAYGLSFFYVLSGYWIFQLWESYDGKLLLYFRNRVLRLLPAFVVAAIAYSWFFPQTFPVWDHLFFIFNLIQYAESTRADLGPSFFNWKESAFHFWSTAIEVQMYAILSVILYLVNRRYQLTLLFTLAIISALLRSWLLLQGTQTSLPGLLPLVQMEYFCWGAWISTWPKEESTRYPAKYWPYILGILAVLLTVFRPAGTIQETQWRVGAIQSVRAAFLGIFLWVILTQRWKFLNRVLSHPITVGIGTLSYSFYLYHPLCLSVMEKILPFTSGRKPIEWIVGFFCSLAIAYLSWWFIERPVSKFRKKLDAKASLETQLIPSASHP